MAHAFVYARSLRADSPSQPPPDRLLNTRQVRDELNCSRSMVYKLIDQGDLECVKVGNSVRVPLSSIVKYIALRTVRIDE